MNCRPTTLAWLPDFLLRETFAWKRPRRVLFPGGARTLPRASYDLKQEPNNRSRANLERPGVFWRGRCPAPVVRVACLGVAWNLLFP
jgi:hypothetical protein